MFVWEWVEWKDLWKNNAIIKCALYFVKTEMSVFGDFRNVWVQRFPGSDLPAAWEEDVRANLAKHKQKVAVLREELEKEEFYVEYLERLLIDVAKHKTRAASDEEGNSDDKREGKGTDRQKIKSRPDSMQNMVLEEGTETSGNNVDDNQPIAETAETINNDSVNQCISELSVALPDTRNISRSNSEVPNRNKISENRRPRCNTHPDISNYVTVIEVNGLNVKGDGMKEVGDNQVAATKKVPPTPPPKKFYNKSKSGNNGSTNSVDRDDDGGNQAEEIQDEQNQSESKETPSEVQDEGAAACVRKKSVDSVEADMKLDEPFMLEKSPLEDVSSEDGVLPDDEEPYYDSVALDGEYVYLQAGGTGGGSSTMTSGSSGTTDTTDSNAATMMTLPSSSPLCRSQQRAGAEGRSSSMESEDETEVPPLLRTISMETDDASAGGSDVGGATPFFAGSSSSLESTAVTTPAPARKLPSQDVGSKAEAERITMYRCIIASIIESETAYLECLNIMLQYMKAIKATLTTSQPVISEDEFSTMFYKIPELHALHQNFLDGLKLLQTGCKQPQYSNLVFFFNFLVQFLLKNISTRASCQCLQCFASNINIYGAFLHNYGRATDTVRKCSASNAQFADITRDIRLKSLGGGQSQSLSLEDLLHKPVARVQKNALVLHSADRAQRRLVKNSFIVELSDGHRKLRHLFLFNDVIACAKYKASGRDKFTFELKWYIPLCDIVIFEEPAVEPRENSPANIVALKSQACTVRDQILWDERNDDKRSRLGSRGSDKQRKKLADLEAQLVLASPNLVFRVGNRSAARTYTFFLSSEFERTQWIEAVHALQSCQLPSPGGTNTVSMYELQAWITACRTFLKTNMGSYLLRTGRDESLLVGDLHLTLKELQDLDQPADLFVCVEVDSYGHYFRKAKSKLVCNSANPRWNEQFIIELEGSQNLRILLYEESQDRAILRAKCTQKLSRSWLGERAVDKLVPMHNCSLLVTLQFVPSEVTLRRVPTARTAGLFGAKIQQVCKRQKREVPFIVTACVREVERRGMGEVGIYRVSGSASDLGRLKKSFETNSYEAEQLLKEVDIHSVTGILKLYLRELPEALFTDELYPKFFEAFNSSGGSDAATKRRTLLHQCFNMLPQQNQNIINYLLAHLVRVNQHEAQNKMSLHNLATVFGPTLLRPGCSGSGKSDSGSRQQRCDPLAAGTVDVMAQAGILYYFLQCHANPGQQS
ncbi:hypothetical protein C0J52_20850 [Blattella germanica]|nr:hypothetical protein C0J52_20850 [Blattella germanica]